MTRLTCIIIVACTFWHNADRTFQNRLFKRIFNPVDGTLLNVKENFDIDISFGSAEPYAIQRSILIKQSGVLHPASCPANREENSRLPGTRKRTKTAIINDPSGSMYADHAFRDNPTKRTSIGKTDKSDNVFALKADTGNP